MDPKLIALLSLQTLGQVTGNAALSLGINKLIGAYQAGVNVDNYMKAIGGKLEAGTLLDTWVDIQEKIDAEVADFLDESPVDPVDPDPPAAA